MAWERERLPQERIDRQRAALSERSPDAEIVLQQVRHAVARVLVDGHGHLYVVPELDLDTRRALAREQGRAPVAVDVYSTNGEHLFSGLLNISDWDASLGDHVYRIGYSDGGEQMLHRYRLVEPFQ